MSQFLDELRLKRIRREQDDVDALNVRIVQAERDHADAQRAFDIAQTALRVRAAELDVLRLRDRAARQELVALRREFQRDFMRHFPMDLLQNIFEHVMDFADDDCGSFAHNATRIAAPFALAAVCSTWRAVVMRQSMLWSYISVSQDVAHRASTLKRVIVQLERSQTAPLDVSLTFVRQWEHATVERAVLQQIAQHARRWRSFELSFPDNANDNSALRVLRGPLPLLEHLSIIDDNGDNYVYLTGGEDFLPHAPRLRTLSLWGPNAVVPSSVTCFPSLRSLRLWYHPNFSYAWAMLATAAPTLDSLMLAFNDESLRLMVPATDITFPNLRSLGLCGISVLMPHLQAMRMPRLEHLAVELEEAPGHWGAFLESVAPTVSALTLTGDVWSGVMYAFAPLARVERLVFGRFAPEHGEEYTVAASFFESRDLWVQHRLWPRLASVTFTSRGKLDLDAGGSVLPFLRWRTSEIGQGADAPSRLRECVFEGVNLPEWMQAEVERLIETSSA